MDLDDPSAGKETDQQIEGGKQVTGADDVTFEVDPLDTRIKKESIDPENALFVVLGMALTVMIVVRFLSILP